MPADLQLYPEYHESVVKECVALMSGRCKNDDDSTMSDEQIAEFFGKLCSYEEEFAERIAPAEVAERQWEAIT